MNYEEGIGAVSLDDWMKARQVKEDRSNWRHWGYD